MTVTHVIVQFIILNKNDVIDSSTIIVQAKGTDSIDELFLYKYCLLGRRTFSKPGIQNMGEEVFGNQDLGFPTWSTDQDLEG